MQKLGVGIIGAGNISTSYLRLTPLFAALDMKAVADINIDAAKNRADEFGVDAEDVDGLLGRDDIDVVVNLTIPDAHFPVTKSILEAGKHAYTEKPIVLTMEEGEILRTIASERNLRVGSAPDTFFGGAHQLARSLVDDGMIGDVVGGTCHVMSHGMEHWHPNPDFFFLPGAGPVLDIGPYYIANLIQLIGPIERVAALTSSATPTRTIQTEGPRKGEEIPVKTPTNIHALMEFENGATITLGASWDVWVHGHAPMELYGTEGSLFVPDPNFFGGTVQMAGRDGEVRPVANTDHPFYENNEDHPDLGPLANYRTAGLADMTAAMVEGRPHRCSLEMALHTVDVMKSILKSGETGTFVDIKTTCERPAALTSQDARTLLMA